SSERQGWLRATSGSRTSSGALSRRASSSASMRSPTSPRSGGIVLLENAIWRCVKCGFEVGEKEALAGLAPKHPDSCGGEMLPRWTKEPCLKCLGRLYVEVIDPTHPEGKFQQSCPNGCH